MGFSGTDSFQSGRIGERVRSDETDHNETSEQERTGEIENWGEMDAVPRK
jgi:hypothetical protein